MPAYNVEKTIKKAAYSCVNQSLKDIELIIVDDCSTDSTRDLMVEIKNEYPDKVKILFQEKNRAQPSGNFLLGRLFLKIDFLKDSVCIAGMWLFFVKRVNLHIATL